jgi:hypothetical protein
MASTCSAAPDPELPAEDIALGYKQLREVECGRRDLKQVIDLRPVYHRKEERIRAHVILCRLALLLIRITETTTGVTWAKTADELSLLTPRHLHRPGRHIPADRRAHQDPARPARQAQNPAPEEDHRGNPGNPLTSSDTTG